MYLTKKMQLVSIKQLQGGIFSCISVDKLPQVFLKAEINKITLKTVIVVLSE